jgi:hypothetical protein
MRIDMEEKQANGQQTAQPTAAQLSVRWDDSDMKRSYANVTNVSSTLDELVLIFGINQSWERGRGEVTVQLSNRIILSPFAAKRLAAQLNNVIREYKSRFGELNLEGRRGAEPCDQFAR